MNALMVLARACKAIPWQAWAVLAALGGLWGLYGYGYHRGSAAEHAANQAMQLAMEKAWAEEIVRKQQTVTKVVTRYVDRVIKEKDTSHRILEEVNADETISNYPYPLPGAVRLHFDAAAAGSDPAPAAGADAAPITLKALTAATVEDLGLCHETAERLTALQAYVRAWVPEK